MKKNKITNNLGLKILAVFISVILWFVILNIDDPVKTNTLNGISVEILNGEILEAENKVYEVLDGTDNISVTVSAKRSVLEYITSANIRATADMNDLNREDGTIRINLIYNKSRDQLETLKPKTEFVKIAIEDMVRSQFVIGAELTGEVAEGYVVGGVSMNQNVVYVSGPESVISEISKVGVQVSVEGMSSNIDTNMDLSFYDKDGNVLPTDKIKTNISDVNISIEIFNTKEVGLSFETSGTPAYGYGVTGVITSTPAKITVAGKVSLLANLETIEVPASALNVEGQSEDFVTTLDIELPKGIIRAGEDADRKVKVTVKIAEQGIISATLKKSDIEINGIPDGMTAVFSNMKSDIEYEVMGMEDDLAKFDESKVKATIDLESFLLERDLDELDTDTTYLIPVDFNLPDGVTLKRKINTSLSFTKTKK